MIKKVLIVCVIASGLALLGRAYLGHQSGSRPVSYYYEMNSQGGMGAQLKIESSWKGNVTLSENKPQEWMLLPNGTKAEVIVNGEVRQDLIERPLLDYEKPFMVELDSVLGLPKKVNYDSAINESSLLGVLENQLKSLAH